MEALPYGSLHGAMRMTEQGETIAEKYAHIGSAVYNAELLMASATAATASHRIARSHEEPNLSGLLDRLAASSGDAYRALLHAPGFITFYRQATPIDALENSRIGSRPARRTGQASLDDLRAIPWVFSWTQSRFYPSDGARHFSANSGARQLARKNTASQDVQLMRSFELPVARSQGLFHLNTVHETAAHLPGRQLFAHCRSSHLPGFGPQDDLCSSITSG